MKSITPAVQNRRHILIVDDHPITRYGLAQLINDEPDLVVSGEAEDAASALRQLSASPAELVLMDITLPGKSGLDLIKDILAFKPDAEILVMSMHDESVYAERVLRAGGRGYIMKTEGGGKLLEAIRTVLAGEVYVTRQMASQILDGFSRSKRNLGQPRPNLLSDREFEVFQMIGQGLSTREIAQGLSLSLKTVGTHRLHIKDKLQLRSGAELVRYAVRWAASQQLV